MRVAVVIASRGRPEALGQLIDALAAQAHAPEWVYLSVVEPSDLPAINQHNPFTVKTIFGAAGACQQRNRALSATEDQREAPDLIVIYDDDFLPSIDALAQACAIFEAHPALNGASGHVIADGATGPEIGHAKAQSLLARDLALPRDREPRATPIGLYGCNMVLRASAVCGLRFDEALPRYSWLEDMDFAARIPPRIGRIPAFRGVHRGVKAAREGHGNALGYAQIANPYYLYRKGTLPLSFALRIASRNLIANHLKALRPEPWVDRAGRARGNRRALTDLLRGRLSPDRA